MEEFRNATSLKIVNCILATVIVGVSLFLFTIDFSRSGYGFLIFPIFFLLLAVFIVLNVFRRSISISAEKIIVISIFYRKEVNTANIKGYRKTKKYLIIETFSPENPTLTINGFSDLGNSEVLVAWFETNFTDLDTLELKEKQDQILHDSSLGVNEEERKEKLVKAVLYSRIYNMTGVAVAIGALLIDNYLLIIILLLYPFIGIILLNFGEGLIKFVANSKRSPYPFIIFGLFTTAFMQLIKCLFFYNILDYQHVWSISFWLSILLFAPLLFINIKNKDNTVKGQPIYILILALAFGFGSTIAINCTFDKSPLHIYQTKVLSQHITRGKSNSYYLKIDAWGPQKEAEVISVQRSLYDKVTVGQSININFKTGLFNIPWFTISN